MESEVLRLDVVVCMCQQRCEVNAGTHHPIPKETRKLCVSIKKCSTEANSAGQYIENYSKYSDQT